jgi:hypothetical protein
MKPLITLCAALVANASLAASGAAATCYYNSVEVVCPGGADPRFMWWGDARGWYSPREGVPNASPICWTKSANGERMQVICPPNFASHGIAGSEYYFLDGRYAGVTLRPVPPAGRTSTYDPARACRDNPALCATRPCDPVSVTPGLPQTGAGTITRDQRCAQQSEVTASPRHAERPSPELKAFCQRNPEACTKLLTYEGRIIFVPNTPGQGPSSTP